MHRSVGLRNACVVVAISFTLAGCGALGIGGPNHNFGGGGAFLRDIVLPVAVGAANGYAAAHSNGGSS